MFKNSKSPFWTYRLTGFRILFFYFSALFCREEHIFCVVLMRTVRLCVWVIWWFWCRWISLIWAFYLCKVVQGAVFRFFFIHSLHSLLLHRPIIVNSCALHNIRSRILWMIFRSLSSASFSPLSVLSVPVEREKTIILRYILYIQFTFCSEWEKKEEDYSSETTQYDTLLTEWAAWIEDSVRSEKTHQTTIITIIFGKESLQTTTT